MKRVQKFLSIGNANKRQSKRVKNWAVTKFLANPVPMIVEYILFMYNSKTLKASPIGDPSKGLVTRCCQTHNCTMTF